MNNPGNDRRKKKEPVSLVDQSNKGLLARLNSRSGGLLVSTMFFALQFFSFIFALGLFNFILRNENIQSYCRGRIGQPDLLVPLLCAILPMLVGTAIYVWLMRLWAQRLPREAPTFRVFAYIYIFVTVFICFLVILQVTQNDFSRFYCQNIG